MLLGFDASPSTNCISMLIRNKKFKAEALLRATSMKSGLTLVQQPDR